MNVTYNFRLAPEAAWLVVNTVIGTLLVEVLARLVGVNSPGELGDISSWLWGLTFGGVRTALGALLAAATGGGFQAPGVRKEIRSHASVSGTGSQKDPDGSGGP